MPLVFFMDRLWASIRLLGSLLELKCICLDDTRHLHVGGNSERRVCKLHLLGSFYCLEPDFEDDHG